METVRSTDEFALLIRNRVDSEMFRYQSQYLLVNRVSSTNSKNYCYHYQFYTNY